MMDGMSRFNLERWRALWDRLGATGRADPVYARLRRAHGQWWRAYHDAVHVADCLARLDELKAAASDLDPGLVDADLLEVAFWFHDAVYVPWLPRNEERSAAWAQRELCRAGLDARRVGVVAGLILATRHGRVPSGSAAALPDEAWMVDIDLSILGAGPERFARFERQIRREYRWVGASRYRAGRRAVLAGFLDAPSIYRTAWFRQRHEASARRNLEGAVAALGG